VSAVIGRDVRRALYNAYGFRYGVS